MNDTDRLRRQAQQDQIDAAARRVADTRDTIVAITDLLHDGDYIEDAPKPDWYPTELHRACPHIGNQPMPVMALISEPSKVYCTKCILPALAEAIATSPQNCDECKKFIASNKFHETQFFAPPIIFVGNVCTPCRDAAHGR